jgi:nitrite reductase/ring-hydroxylating ferredoxin subunit
VTALAASGHLGGHLSYARGVGVDQTVFEPAIDDWTDVAAEADVTEGALVGGQAGTTAVLVTRRDGVLHALADRCSHRGGPLHEGELEDGCVTCPWHGSRFALADGSVVRGPAAYPQPVYEVRTEAGRILVRSPGSS